MSSQYFTSIANQGYATLWNKYRPAILQLMVAAAEGPQEYKFFKHEFKALNPKEKTYAFTLEAFQNKAINGLKASNIAKDLLYVLSLSPKASELMENNTFVFTLDKQFVLHISQTESAEGETSDDQEEETDEGEINNEVEVGSEDSDKKE